MKGLQIQESVLLPPGWVYATQDDRVETYLGPLKDIPANPKFTRLKLARDIYNAVLRISNHPESKIAIDISEYPKLKAGIKNWQDEISDLQPYRP
jgi:hypothetical protein